MNDQEILLFFISLAAFVTAYNTLVALQGYLDRRRLRKMRRDADARDYNNFT